MSQETQEFIINFFTDLLGFEPDITVEMGEKDITIQLQLDPNKSGVVIGYKGEVLTSIQLLLALMVQQRTGNWVPVRLNVNDYREQRVDSLEQLAENSASKAVATGETIKLGNLSSYERRIVHSYLSEDERVETHSEGEEPNRVLLVTAK